MKQKLKYNDVLEYEAPESVWGREKRSGHLVPKLV